MISLKLTIKTWIIQQIYLEKYDFMLFTINKVNYFFMVICTILVNVIFNFSISYECHLKGTELHYPAPPPKKKCKLPVED